MVKNAIWALVIVLSLLSGHQLITGAAPEVSIIEISMLFFVAYLCLSYQPSIPEGQFIRELLVAMNEKDKVIDEYRRIMRHLDEEERARVRVAGGEVKS